MKIAIELKILKNFGGYDPESPFIQEYSILTIKHNEKEYNLGFMQLDSSVDYKLTLREAIDRLLDRNCFISGRNLADIKLEELISNGYCKVDI